MAGRIPAQFLQTLLRRVDLAEVVQRHVPLQRAGGEYKACCPFHNEKTPSFTVSPAKGFYHCFGCGAHGTAITFLMEYGKYSFVDAVEELAAGQGLEVPREGGGGAPREDFEPLYECLEAACRWYQRELKRAGPGQEYAKRRGLSGEICRDYRIGYAPAGFDNAKRELGSKYSDELLLKAGLLAKKEARSYDRFRHRLMFPIRDGRGRVLGFGGRAVGADDKPKYLNTAETPVFRKGRILYGVHELQQRPGKIETLVLTEGYMDVVSLAQAGVGNALATLGTSTTADHLRLLGRFCRRFIFCFDGDRAGRDAGWRALENLLEVMRDGDEYRFAHLPEGEDPDSYVRKHGVDSWKNFLAEAQPFEKYFWGHLEQGVTSDGMTGIAGKAAVVERARPLIAKLRVPVFRTLMDKEAGKLRSELQKLTDLDISDWHIETDKKPTFPRAERSRKKYNLMPAVDRMISILLKYPNLALRVPQPDFLSEIMEPNFRLLTKIVKMVQADPDPKNIKTAEIIESFRGPNDQEAHSSLSELFIYEPPELHGVAEEKDLYDTVDEFVRKFHLKWIDLRIAKLNIKHMSVGLNVTENAERKKLTEEKLALIRRKEREPRHRTADTNA